jgi:hypothetical protein
MQFGPRFDQSALDTREVAGDEVDRTDAEHAHVLLMEVTRTPSVPTAASRPNEMLASETTAHEPSSTLTRTDLRR